MTDHNGEQESFNFNVSPPAQQVIADAMRRVDENADEHWKTVFDQCVIEAARKKPEITSDDVLDELEAIPDRPHTHNLAAIGPAMKRAASEGILTSTGRVVRSARAVKHGIRHTIWKSNIYRETCHHGTSYTSEQEKGISRGRRA